MKKIICLIIFSLLIINDLHPQYDPPEIEFVGLEENWKYLSYDSNFVKFASYATPYGGRIPIRYMIVDNQLFINEVCDAQNPYSGFDGSLIHNIDINTGKVNWIDFNNRYTGNKHFLLIPTGGMAIDQNGDIELMGFMSYDTMMIGKPGHYFYSRPMKRIIDFNTGELLEVVKGKDTLNNYAALNIGNFHKNSKGQWLRYYHDSFLKDSILHDRVSFFKLDMDLNIEYPAYDSILHCTNIRTNSYFLSYSPKVIELSPNTLVCIFGTRDPAQNDILTELTMTWIDISDIDSIKVVDTIDILGDMVMPLSDERITSFTKDENIVLMQLVLTSDTLAPAQRYTWISWFDKSGKRIAKVDYLNSNSYIYDQGDVSVIGVKDGNLYITANRKDEEYRIHDVLEIKPGLNNINRASSIKAKKNDGTIHYFEAIAFAPNDEVLARIAVVKRIEGVQTIFHYYYSLNASDLGIITKTLDFESPIANLDIHPNPTTHSITISHGYEGEARIEVLDVMGRVLTGKTAMSAGEDELDVSVLNAGVYVVRVLDRRGVVVGRGKFLRR